MAKSQLIPDITPQSSKSPSVNSAGDVVFIGSFNLPDPPGTGTNGLWKFHFGDAEPTLLVENPIGVGDPFFSTPRWSPNSSLVVYERGVFDTDQNVCNLRICNADGSSDHAVTTFTRGGDENTVTNAWASFSPDNATIMFGRDTGPATDINLWTIGVDGTGLTQVTSHTLPDRASQPFWGSNNKIICRQSVSGVVDIVTMDPDGNNVVVVTPAMAFTIGDLGNPNWNSDCSKYLCVVEDTLGAFYLVECNANGSSPSIIIQDNTGLLLTQEFVGVGYYPNDTTLIYSLSEYLLYITFSQGISFAEFKNTDYADWPQETGDFPTTVGWDFSSYFISGYKLRGEGIRKFQSNWLKLFMKNPSHVDFAGRWDYTVADTSGRFTQVQRIQLTDTDRTYSSRRLKVRGRGDVLQIKILSVSGQPFDITGWTTFDTVNQKP